MSKEEDEGTIVVYYFGKTIASPIDVRTAEEETKVFGILNP